MEGERIKHISFYSGLIQTMGYDPQNALLEVRLLNDGKIRQYRDVPEDIWYCMRENRSPDAYYRRYICGCYPESVIAEIGRQPDACG